MKISFCGCNQELKICITQGLDENDAGVGAVEAVNFMQSKERDKKMLFALGKTLATFFEDGIVTETSLIDVFAWSDYLSYAGKLSVTVRDAAANALEAGLKYYDAVFYLPFDKHASKEERAVDRIIQDYIAQVRISNRKQNIIKLSGDLQTDIKKVQVFIKSK